MRAKLGAENSHHVSLTIPRFSQERRKGDTKYFNGERYRGNDLDFIAFNEGVFYGIEVKNKISHPDFQDDIMAKKSVADFHDIQFVLISRNPGRNGIRLFEEGGLHLDYGYYIWNPNFSQIAEKAKEKLRYPVKSLSSPPGELVEEVKKISKWHEKHFPEKGRI